MDEKTETQLVREAFEKRISELERALETAMLTLAEKEREIAALSSIPGDGSALQPPPPDVNEGHL